MPLKRRQIAWRVAQDLSDAACVRQVYADLAVIKVTAEGLLVRERVEDIDFATLQVRTGASLHPAPEIKPLRTPEP
ncbi:MAG: hypothetical protein JO038_10370 [Alphaproteobacteria bacterium]|nr:hypothetical protein [Alphaproteobacteria bacterium]